MKTAASLSVAALVFAALATSAAAKEIKSAKVCGASDCVTVTDREQANLLLASETPGSPPPASSFYTVEVTIDVEGEPTSTVYYVPSAAMARPAYEPGAEAGPSLLAWSRVTPDAAALFREVARGLEPFPKPDLSSVVIGPKIVVDGADSYLRLLELPSPSGTGGLPIAYSEWIDLRSPQPTPWTDSSRDLSFSPSAGLLARDGQAVRIPEELLADMRAGRPLAGDDGDAQFAWQTLVATLAIALAAVVAIALLFRRRDAPRARRSRRAARARG